MFHARADATTKSAFDVAQWTPPLCRIAEMPNAPKAIRLHAKLALLAVCGGDRARYYAVRQASVSDELLRSLRALAARTRTSAPA